MEPKYKRIILKVSGEALAGDKRFGLNTSVINKISEHIKKCHDMGVEIAIVVGGGNGRVHSFAANGELGKTYDQLHRNDMDWER